MTSIYFDVIELFSYNIQDGHIWQYLGADYFLQCIFVMTALEIEYDNCI